MLSLWWLSAICIVLYKRWRKRKEDLKEKNQNCKNRKAQLIGLRDPAPVTATSAHPDTERGAVTEFDSHFIFLPSLRENLFFHPWTYPPHRTTLFKKIFPPTPLLYLC
jgi:hypothetical protein